LYTFWISARLAVSMKNFMLLNLLDN
jgi:hypothetical protein